MLHKTTRPTILSNYLLVDAQEIGEPHSLDTKRTTGTLTFIVFEPFNELNGFLFLLRRAYINMCSRCKAYKGLKETTPKYIISS